MCAVPALDPNYATVLSPAPVAVPDAADGPMLPDLSDLLVSPAPSNPQPSVLRLTAAVPAGGSRRWLWEAGDALSAGSSRAAVSIAGGGTGHKQAADAAAGAASGLPVRPPTLRPVSRERQVETRLRPNQSEGRRAVQPFRHRTRHAAASPAALTSARRHLRPCWTSGVSRRCHHRRIRWRPDP